MSKPQLTKIDENAFALNINRPWLAFTSLDHAETIDQLQKRVALLEARLTQQQQQQRQEKQQQPPKPVKWHE